MAMGYLSMTQHLDPHGCPPEPRSLNSPQAILVCTTFPRPAPRVSDCKQNFVHLPFKSMPVTSADFTSPWKQKSCCFLQWAAYVHACSWLWCSGLKSLAWGLCLHFSEATTQLSNPSSTSAPACLWEWGQPFSHHCPSYLSHGFFYKSLVIRLLFSKSLVGF